MKLLLLASLVLVVSCAPKSNDASIEKPMLSVWKSESPNWLLDLSTPNKATWTYWTGGKCETDVSINSLNMRDQDFGHLVSTNAITLNLVPGDPPCSQFENTWVYAVSRLNHLTLCDENNFLQCEEFN